MFDELKCDLHYAKEYLDTLLLVEKEPGMIETKRAVKEALQLIKILNDRMTIANNQIRSGRLPKARVWSDIKLEYEAVYHLERLHNEPDPEIWGGEGD